MCLSFHVWNYTFNIFWSFSWSVYILLCARLELCRIWSADPSGIAVSFSFFIFFYLFCMLYRPLWFNLEIFVFWKAFREVVSVELAMAPFAEVSGRRKTLNRGFAFVRFATHGVRLTEVQSLCIFNFDVCCYVKFIFMHCRCEQWYVFVYKNYIISLYLINNPIIL